MKILGYRLDDDDSDIAVSLNDDNHLEITQYGDGFLIEVADPGQLVQAILVLMEDGGLGLPDLEKWGYVVVA